MKQGDSNMMQLGALMSPEAILVGISAKSQEIAVQRLVTYAAKQLQVSSSTLIEAIDESTARNAPAQGHGVAILHATNAQIKGMHGFCMLLERPVDFDAADHVPVDIIYLLANGAVPTGLALRTLSKITRLLHDNDRLERLRGCRNDAEAVFALLNEDFALAA